jgi:hypothetical protein
MQSVSRLVSRRFSFGGGGGGGGRAGGGKAFAQITSKGRGSKDAKGGGGGGGGGAEDDGDSAGTPGSYSSFSGGSGVREQTFTGEAVQVATWLQRQTKFGGQWRNYYFVLHSNCVLQKYDKPDGKLLREYDVAENHAVLDMLDGRSFKIAKFVRTVGSPLRERGEVFVADRTDAEPEYLHLLALSDANKESWLLALHAIVREGMRDGLQVAGNVSFMDPGSDDDI